MPNKKKLFNALVQEGYDNFDSESSFNAYIDNADNRKKLFNALKEEGYDNFTDEKAFDEYLGYDSETQSKPETYETQRVGNTIIGGIGTQEEADSIFDANAKAVREKYSKQPDQEQGIPESELKRLQSIKDTAQKQIDEAGFFDRFFDADTRAAVAARNQAEEALETYEEAQHAENGWFDRNVMGVLRGIADKATDLSTWDFGVSGIASATALNDAYEKWEKGEQLTSAEQNMLDAYGLATAVQAAYQDKVGTAYKVGGSLPESAAFSASFILNPAAGVGKKLAEATAKAAVKKYGTSLVSKLAKGAARAGGDVAEMAVATAIPGGFRVAEDYYNRLNGQSTFDVDENGIIRYGGQAEQEEADDAIWKAFGSQFIENYSETMGNYFAPMGTMLSNLTSKGLKAAHLGKLADVVNDISSSQFSRGLKRFKEATKFDGLVGEYLEEVAGNVINAATVGDMNFKSPEDPRSVFNPETNIETFLSCALMSGTMYAVEAPVSIYNKVVAKRNLNNADKVASELWGDRWNDMRSQMDEADPQLLAQLLTGVQNATDLSDEQKAAAKNYGMRLMQYQGYNARRLQNQAESTDEANEINNAYDRGADMVEPADKHNAKIAMDKAEAALADDSSFLQEVINGQDNPVATITAMVESGKYSDDQIAKAKDYYVAYRRMNGLTDSVLERVNSRINDANKEVDANTNVDENTGARTIVPVTLRDGRKGYVLKGTVTPGEKGSIDVNKSDSYIIVRVDGKNLPMNPNKDLVSVGQITSPESLKEYNSTQLREQLINEEIGEIDWNPATPNPKIGDSFEMDGIAVTIVDQDGQGGMFVVPTEEWKAAQGSEQKVQQLILQAQQAGSVPASMFKQWASNQLDAQEEAAKVEQEVASGEAVSEQVNNEVNTELNKPETNGENVSPVEVAQQPQVEVQQAPVIPTKEDGSIDFVTYGKEGSFKELGNMYGEKMPHKVEVTAKALAEDLVKAQSALDKAQEALDNAPIGREAKAKAALDKAQQEYDAVKRESDFWAEMDADIKASQARRDEMLNPKVEANMSEEPISSDEFVAQQLSNGNIALTSESFKKETGYGEAERKKFIKIIRRSENGGMTIEEAGERLMEMDRENGTNFFDQSDPNAGRDAIINMLGMARTWGDITNYIRNNRQRQAEADAEGIRSEMEEAIWNAYHVTPEEYVTMLEMELQENPYEGIDLAALDAIFAEKEFGEEQKSEEYESGTDVEGNQGQSELLSEERAGDTAGNQPGETVEQAEGFGSGAQAEGETAQAGTSVSRGVNVFAEAERIDKEEQRRKPLRERAREWSKALGVKVNFIERFEDVKNKTAIRAINEGQQVAGWFELGNGEVYFYMPNLESMDEVDKTYIHEVVSHKGLPKLLGKEKFDELCDKVWDMMPQSARNELMSYPGVNGDKRIAADEYIAYLSESVDLTPEEKTIWDNIVQFFREALDKALNGIIGKSRITNADIANLIKASYANLKSEAGNVAVQIEKAREEVDQNPTEAQKEAGNYKKGHIKIDGYDITIENPKGGVRSGTDKNGKKWSITMNNDYGYIRGTEAVDGDHIDVFLSDNPTEGNVFVVDQSNEDGSFDESKVMYGFNSLEEARDAYLSNYSAGWENRIQAITEVSKDEFKKWIDSSHRKTKAFSEYKSVKITPSIEETNVSRMSDIEERLAGIEGERIEIEDQLNELGNSNPIASADLISSLYKLDREQADLESEYSGLRAMNDESNAILEEEGSELRFKVYKSKDGKETKYKQLSLFGEGYEAANDRDRPDNIQREGNSTISRLNHLRELQEGEICNVERRFTESREFSFTRGEKVESTADIAYIFKSLEDEAVENSFVAIANGDNITVIHLGMGAQTQTVVDSSAIIAAVERLNADKVFFVHNHPSGEVRCSRQDILTYQSLKKVLGSRLEDGIIINTRSGKYGLFNSDGLVDANGKIASEKTEYPINVYKFNKQAFNVDVIPTVEPSSSGIAEFVSTQRLGKRDKVNALLLNNQFGCVGNILIDNSKNLSYITERITNDAIAMGARQVVIYGRYPFVEVTNSKTNFASYLSRMISEYSQGNVNLIDIIQIDEPYSRSANDEGVRFRRVYHGSGASFDRFDHSFMSTGEGNQSYGWGSYVTDVEGIARGYADSYSIFESGFGDFYLRKIREGLDNGKSFKEVKQELLDHHRYLYDKAGGNTSMYGDFISDYQKLMNLEESGLPSRHLYNVEIPDNNGTNYLEWDKPLSEQNKKRIKDAVLNSQMYKDYAAKYGETISLERLNSWLNAFDAGRVYRLLENFADNDDSQESAKTISKLLSDAGYVGFEYPANFMSGGNENGEKNYVIFNEHDLDIVEHTRFRAVKDKKLIDKLESEPKIKVYRAMQLIDGNLYPPMSAKVDGKLREPIELGKWEEAEERPDLADKKGYFKLDKGNKTSLKARYNPYIHTSTTPLNDQFSSAQDRPELVTVEVEIPESELTSGYKAEKAKDSVGKLEWKAGVVQGKLSGTRTVILSRWDKPIRIVPDSEVAKEIVKMFGNKKITMPSNVVTPSLRSELEKLGVPFVETDNRGKEIGNTRFRLSDKGRKIQNEVDKFTSKYNSKEVVLVDSEMTDEEFEYAIPYSSAERTREEIAKGFTGGYSHISDKIYTFVDNQSVEGTENTMFHENLHLLFDGSKLVNDFYERAKDEEKKVMDIIKEQYDESEYANELFANIVAWDLTNANFKHIERYLTDEQQKEFFNKVKEIGYDKEQESASRRAFEELERNGSGRNQSNQVPNSEVEQRVQGKTSQREQAERLKVFFDQVADMGLDGVLGNKAYEKLLMDIYNEIPEKDRSTIDSDADSRYNGNHLPAVSDYINHAEPTIIDKIVSIVREALRKAGFDMELSSNDVKYMLWRSRKRLNRNNILDVAEDIDALRRFGTSDNTTRFSIKKKKENFDVSDKRDKLLKEYDAFLKTGKFNFIEAFQDRMYSLKVLMDKVVEATGKKVRDYEDAYKAENQLGSINKPMQEKYLKNFYKPLLESVKELSDKYSREAVERYIYCKSGLERNVVLRQRDADEAYNSAKAELDEKLAKNEVDQAQYNILLKQAEDQRNKTLSEDVDYSGIRGMLFNSKAQDIQKEYEEGKIDKSTRDARLNNLEANRSTATKDWKKFAEAQVAALEGKASDSELDALWDRINAATNETLRMDYESGMIDKETYDAEKNMMKYYVPLRNWDDTTAEEMYEYRSDLVRPVSSNQKRAKGRESQADNPIVTIGLMAQSAIVRGNRNKVKQKFYAFVANRETSLATVRDVWYVKDPSTGDWTPQYADTSSAKNSSEFDAIIAQFEEDMKLLEEQVQAFRGKLPFGMKFKASASQKKAHVVPVMINGIEYAVYVNGNPRAAQAINGETNNESVKNTSEWLDKLKRLYGAGLTSWNPDFIIPNLVRDTIHASTMTMLDSGPIAAIRYMFNTPKMFWNVGKMVTGLGNADPKLEAYFKEFVDNGGETGYTAINTLEDYKKEYEKLIDEAKGVKASAGKNVKKAFGAMAKVLEAANRIAEDANRFNAYVSARESGESIIRSVDAAKNITVNFNRKGALSANDSAFGTVANAMSKWILFFNPAVQGIAQIVTKSKMNPKRAASMGATILASGFMMPMLNEMLVAAAGDDEEDDYWNQSDYKRRNNWMLFTGDGYMTFPLPPILRELYGIGDVIYGTITGHITAERAAMDIARQVQSAVGFFNLIPEVSQEPDMVTYAKGFAPDIAAPIIDVISNTNFMGRPIAKWTDYNKYDPEYERVYKGTSKHWVELSMLLNEAGGNEGKRSDLWGNFINPAMMEHLITSYGGGIGKTINNLVGMALAEGEDNVDPFRKTPIIPRFYTPNDEKTVVPGINRKYYDYNYKYNVAKKALKNYQEGISSGEHPEWQKYIDEMKRNKEIEFINYFKEMDKRLKKLQNLLKGNPTNKESLEEQIVDLKAKVSAESWEILK